MSQRKDTALLIPYKIKNDEFFVYLQKRAKDSKTLPDHISFFGGKVEAGETIEQALVREIKEELNFEVKEYHFLGCYQSPVKLDTFLNTYYLKVDSDFESKVTIGEGEYGKFFSLSDLDTIKIIESDKKIIHDLSKIV